jgi:hypothetical protein
LTEGEKKNERKINKRKRSKGERKIRRQRETQNANIVAFGSVAKIENEDL